MEQTKTIKTDNGELYVIGDKIVGRMETKGKVTKYYRGDKLHRDGDLPAYIRRNDAQCFAEQSINQCFAEQSINQCFAEQSINQCFAEQSTNGVVICEIYCRDGKKHREGDLPAHIERNDTAVIIGEIYYRDGKLHRDGDLPAYIWRSGTGAITYEEYWRDGKQHRDGDLPAYIVRNGAGIAHEVYYRDGIEYKPVPAKEKGPGQDRFMTMEQKIKEMEAQIVELTADNARLTDALGALKKSILELVA